MPRGPQRASGSDGSSGAKDADGQPDLMLEVNARIHELAGRFASKPDSETWEFRCECGAPDCNQLVELQLAEYDRLRGKHSAILAPGHVRPPADPEALQRPAALTHMFIEASSPLAAMELAAHLQSFRPSLAPGDEVHIEIPRQHRAKQLRSLLRSVTDWASNWQLDSVPVRIDNCRYTIAPPRLRWDEVGNDDAATWLQDVSGA